MVERNKDTLSNYYNSSMKRCELCDENAAKYKCPSCLVQTCSMPCVKQHKANSGCSGQRDKTAYTAMKDFTDLNLLNDYRFLEDAGRKKYRAHKDMRKRRHNLPEFIKELEKQASSRKINLRLMPYPMTRRKNNFTTYHFKSRSILWQIEWVFPQADTTVVDKRKCETDTLESILQGHIGPDGDPITKHKLMPYFRAGITNWKLFLKDENSVASQTRYHTLDISKSITDNLADKTLIEYPTIIVVLRKYWSEYVTVGAEVCISSEDPDVCEELSSEVHSAEEQR